MNQETKLQNSILLALSNAGCLVWRIETAGAWVGRVIHQDGSMVTLSNARMIQAGLIKGGSDIIGIDRATGRFIAIEVKTKTGRPTHEQTRFIDNVRAAGGIAGIARSVQDALDLIERG